MLLTIEVKAFFHKLVHSGSDVPQEDFSSLIALRVNPKARDENDDTALHLAAKLARYNLVGPLLLQDPNLFFMKNSAQRKPVLCCSNFHEMDIFYNYLCFSYAIHGKLNEVMECIQTRVLFRCCG